MSVHFFPSQDKSLFKKNGGLFFIVFKCFWALQKGLMAWKCEPMHPDQVRPRWWQWVDDTWQTCASEIQANMFRGLTEPWIHLTFRLLAPLCWQITARQYSVLRGFARHCIHGSHISGPHFAVVKHLSIHCKNDNSFCNWLIFLFITETSNPASIILCCITGSAILQPSPSQWQTQWNGVNWSCELLSLR